MGDFAGFHPDFERQLFLAPHLFESQPPDNGREIWLPELWERLQEALYKNP